MDTFHADPLLPSRSSGPRSAARPRFARTLGATELLVAACAVVAGVLLLIRPDGSLLAADPEVLTTTPFDDWRIPGIVLAALVGGGFLIAGAAEWRAVRAASALSAAAGTGLVGFEIVQMALIGWHALQPIMMTVGVLMVLMVNLRVATEPRTRRITGDEKG
jgi:hypothetical protein